MMVSLALSIPKGKDVNYKTWNNTDGVNLGPLSGKAKQVSVNYPGLGMRTLSPVSLVITWLCS